jgi:serine/threonine protein kinase
VKAVGRYPLLRLLGKGGMGEVWLSQHPDLNMPVAIKLLRQDLAGKSPVHAARFLREARLAAALTHPDIVRVYDAGCDDDTYFIVMEYMDGVTATRLARDAGGRLAPAQALDIVLAVAGALREAARMSIIHRDIKPDNIMITRDGRVKLTDLGIARQFGADAGPALTRTGVNLGTPHYISPEQAVDMGKVDLRSDIYSLGATFYRLAVGQLPHSGSVALTVMMKHVHEPLPHPRARNTELPDNIAAVICKMMEKRPEARYQTYDDLIGDLTKIKTRNAPVSDLMASQISKSLVLPAPGAGRMAAAARRTRRRQFRWPRAALAVILVALIAAVWFRYRQHREPGTHCHGIRRGPTRTVAGHPEDEQRPAGGIQHPA